MRFNLILFLVFLPLHAACLKREVSVPRETIPSH